MPYRSAITSTGSAPHTFIEDYEWYHELRTKIDGGLYPKRRNKFTQCIQIKTKNYFVTDNRKCMHFRITAMLARHNEDETVALCWKDILKYPCMEELQIEKRMLQSMSASALYWYITGAEKYRGLHLIVYHQRKSKK